MISFFLTLSFFLLSSDLRAEVVYLGAGTEVVDIKANSPTVLRFPSPVRTVSHISDFKLFPANEKDPDYSVQIIRPRIKKGLRSTVFVLSDQSIYKINFNVVPKTSSKADVLYDFKDISSLTTKNLSHSELNTTPVDVMRTLMTRSHLSGFILRKIHAEYVDYGNIEIKLVRVLEGPVYKGLIYRVRNKSNKKVQLRQDLVRLGHPYKPILSHISRKTLFEKKHRKSKALVRVVALTRGTVKPEQIPFGIHQLRKKR